MKSGKCPKCSSSEIYRGRAHNQRSALNISVFKNARLEDFVCAGCGFVESYIIDKAKLDDIRRSWTRVAQEK
jgi:predicted nucleic-acid-binding Zn-ribbon protein